MWKVSDNTDVWHRPVYDGPVDNVSAHWLHDSIKEISRLHNFENVVVS